MGARSRRKGADAEREIVRLARVAGLSAERCWANAQHPDPTVRQCDCLIAGRRVQVRVEGNGFRALYGALDGVELLFVRANRRPWLCVLSAEMLLCLLKRGGQQ